MEEEFRKKVFFLINKKEIIHAQVNKFDHLTTEQRQKQKMLEE